jgi:hypothetical protein
VHFDETKFGALKLVYKTNRSTKTDIDVNWTPIHPLSRQFQVGRNQSSQVLRKQFPLRQSAAKTIHRCQGDTLDQVVVDFTTTRKDAHTHYVGLSRVKTIDGLFILNLCEKKIHVSETVKLEMFKLHSERQLSISLYQPYL